MFEILDSNIILGQNNYCQQICPVGLYLNNIIRLYRMMSDRLSGGGGKGIGMSSNQMSSRQLTKLKNQQLGNKYSLPVLKRLGD